MKLDQHEWISQRNERRAKTPIPVKFKQEVTEKIPSRPLMGGGMSEPLREYHTRPDIQDGLREDYVATVCQSTGTINEALGIHILKQAVDATPLANNFDVIANSVSAALAEMQPQDPMEGMLICQLIALHGQMMYYMGKSISTNDYHSTIDINLNRYTKISKAFVMTMSALMRYKNKGHTLRIEHVNISGGQAMFGQFNADTKAKGSS